jgi:hypothetical protein
VDRFTLGHASVGVIYGLAGLPWWGAVALAVAWEVAENPLKDWFPAAFPDSCHDTYANGAVDAGSVMLGYLGGRALGRRRA